MYSINGAFGKVRLCRTSINTLNSANRPPRQSPVSGGASCIQTPFVFLSGGWHRCNDLYHLKRPQGQEGYLLFFSLSSGGRARIGDSFYELPASSVAILPPNTFHEYYTEKGEWWEFYWLHIAEKNAEILETLTELHGHVFEAAKAPQMGQKVASLFPERTSPDEAMFRITSSQAVSDILHMLLEYTYHTTATSGKHGGVVQNILHEIEDNYSGKISVSELAAKYFISTEHMIRLFKEDTGYTPYEYLKKYRLKKASELLQFSSLSIAQIAETTGFLSGNNFIYQFRNEYGITPAKYRKYF